MNYQLEILEVCARPLVIKKEQFNIDYFKSEYNILTTAGSSLHFKHYEETKFKFKSRMLSDKALCNLRKAIVGAVFFTLAKPINCCPHLISLPLKILKQTKLKIIVLYALLPKNWK